MTAASLVLVLDAIPWAVAHEVWSEGHLPGFSEPVPCVSVFPSFTNIAVPALIGQIVGTRPPGYEARYYRPPSGTIRGGLITAKVDGIDIVIARRSEESALVVRGADEASLEWRDGRCRYLAIRADPLSYAPLLAELQRGGAVDAQGFVDTDGLLTASLRHDYPDALHRIRRALTDLVDFPAPVVFSMRPGFTYGPRLTHVAAAILGGQVGTHGALSSEQSIGFLSVAGLPAPPPVVRAETALVPYRDLVIQGARSS